MYLGLFFLLFMSQVENRQLYSEGRNDRKEKLLRRFKKNGESGERRGAHTHSDVIMTRVRMAGVYQ